MVNDIYHTRVAHGVALAWVNSYSAVVVKTPEATLLFDPVSLAVPQGVPLDLIVVSHEHSDHWDPPLVAQLHEHTGAAVAAPPFLASRLIASTRPDEASHLPPTREGRYGVEFPPTSLYERGESLPRDGSEPWESGVVRPLLPGDAMKVGDVLLTALRCDHAARQPLAFLVLTADGISVYLPGDTTPFPEMAELPVAGPPAGDKSPQPTFIKGGKGGFSPGGQGPGRISVDILLWMGTALADGAEIARLVRPRVLVTYAITPAAAGARAKGILTQMTPGLEFQALERKRVFVYPPLS